MIRVGLIGCGFMGGMHAACYAALAELGVKVTAIADDRPEFLAQMKEQTDAQTYESGMALIEQADVDVVDICLPTYLHTAHACAAMEKGRDETRWNTPESTRPYVPASTVFFSHAYSSHRRMT